MKERKPPFPAVCAAVLGMFLAFGNVYAAAEGRPNVVIIALDPLRADRLEAYGCKTDLAPNINAFAKRSVVYKNAVSPSSWTLPAAMSLLTSLYPHQHKMENLTYLDEKGRTRHSVLSKKIRTLPEVFKAGGYGTAAFMGGAPFFPEYFPSSGLGFTRGFEVFKSGFRLGGIHRPFTQAKKWLEDTPEKKPFFLMVQGFDMHDMVFVRRKAAGGSAPHWEESLWEWFLSAIRQKAMAPPFNLAFSKYAAKSIYTGLMVKMEASQNGDPHDQRLTREEEELLKNSYDGRLAEPDQDFGDFLGFLKKKGLAGNTIIVFLSHHGNGVMSHGQVGHGLNLYDELIHVPLMINVPGRDPGDEYAQVTLLDLGPTLLSLAGLKGDPVFSAQSRGRVLPPFSKAGYPCLSAFAETNYRLLLNKTAVRTCSGWKLISDPLESRKELYNLNADPGELNDLFEKDKAKAYELENELFEWSLK